jgi:hypothetical protein
VVLLASNTDPKDSACSYGTTQLYHDVQHRLHPFDPSNDEHGQRHRWIQMATTTSTARVVQSTEHRGSDYLI